MTEKNVIKNASHKCNNSNNDNRVYIVFSQTPYKMGRMIRFFTKGMYNHVSISLDRDLTELYSFARLYRVTPFCGGFVHETYLRYKVGSMESDVIICAISTSPERKKELKDLLCTMMDNREDYIYNFVSALCVPIRKRINIRNSYTCVEFAVLALNILGYDFSETDFYSINDLFEFLWNNRIYEGKFPSHKVNFSDDYEKSVKRFSRYGKMLKQFGTLAFRMVLHPSGE